jgi:hypothetical protein
LNEDQHLSNGAPSLDFDALAERGVAVLNDGVDSLVLRPDPRSSRRIPTPETGGKGWAREARRVALQA